MKTLSADKVLRELDEISILCLVSIEKPLEVFPTTIFKFPAEFLGSPTLQKRSEKPDFRCHYKKHRPFLYFIIG